MTCHTLRCRRYRPVMRVVLLGGAPGVGKTTVARQLLLLATTGTALVQWVDVDALWLHQPWSVDDRTTRMLRSNLTAVMRNAIEAGVELLFVTWVFQSVEIQELVRSLAPDDTEIQTVQLLAGESAWRVRWASDKDRPAIDSFFADRYEAAQATRADHVIDTTELDPHQTARAVAAAIGM